VRIALEMFGLPVFAAAQMRTMRGFGPIES
jgi:hypothetical protein